MLSLYNLIKLKAEGLSSDFIDNLPISLIGNNAVWSEVYVIIIWNDSETFKN